MKKDWTGNKKATFVTIGATNHSEGEREIHDYYATEPKAMELLLQEESFDKYVWEPAVGEGHLAEVLKKKGYIVRCSDIVDRGYEDTEVLDFFKYNIVYCTDIITNPPYKYAKEFAEHALELIPEGNKVAMFLKLTFLEGQGRRNFFKKNPPKRIYVSSSRLNCAKNGDFEKYKSSALAYAWFVWEKGYIGDPVIKWIN